MYNAVRFAALAAAAILLGCFWPAESLRLGAADFVVLGGALVVALALSVVRAPSALFERGGRPAPHAERIAFLFPLLTAIFALYGAYETAVINALAHLVQPASARPRSPLERILAAAVRVPVWFAIAPLHDRIAHGGVVTFVVIFGAWYLVTNFVWFDVLSAMRRSRSVLHYWNAHVRDAGSLILMLAELLWGFVSFVVLRNDGAAIGLAMFAPLAVTAWFSSELARTGARVQRLTLSREAVEAMLGAHDPLPQMRSILETIDPRITRESVEIFGFGRGGSDAWTSVARMGPTPAGMLSRSAARALYDLRAHGGTVEGVRSSEGLVIAYASHDAERRLRGALVVYRGEGATSVVAAREFERAAAELAPLLFDYGTITATRTAAATDALTGLVNRRTVGRAIDEALAYVRSGGSYAMLLLDVDHFKSINDTMGHNAGDRVLARIGRIIAENVRDGDIAGRFGGEEFLVLMRDATRESVLAIAERLRGAIEASGLTYADGAPITISIGVTYARTGDLSGETIIERADRALYRAKSAGRNRVVESPAA